MFARKKEDKKRPRRTGGGLAQFGLLDVPMGPDLTMGKDDNEDSEEDDDALEAELLALTSGSAPVRPKKSRPVVPKENLDAMIADSLKDVPSGDESVDENDPELLNELSELQDGDNCPSDQPEETSDPVCPPTSTTKESSRSENSLVPLLESRLQLYLEAEKNAKAAGEGVRARRFGRGIKTLGDLLKQAKAGRVVNEEDIPPPVAVTVTKKEPNLSPVRDEQEQPSDNQEDTPASPSRPSRPAPPPPPLASPSGMKPAFGVALPGLTPSDPPASSSSSEEVKVLTERRDQYKIAALQAKRNGDKDTAVAYVKVVKQFERVISALESGQPVDLSQMPPPPPEVGSGNLQTNSLPDPVIDLPKKAEDEKQHSAEGEATNATSEGEVLVDDQTFFNAPDAPTTVLEALEQRLTKYKSQEEAAKNEGNSSKARRMGRIVKQYESAIKLHKAGKPIPIDELPTPPGFAPIPLGDGVQASSPEAAQISPVAPSVTPKQPAPVTPSVPTNPQPATSPVKPSPVAQPSPSTPSSVASPSAVVPDKVNVRKTPQSRQEKQTALLLARQKEFKEAALKAKRNGEINQAKEYLKLAKGFDPLIDASNSGLPVDFTTVPVPPDAKISLESDFDFVTIDDCLPGSDTEIYEKLEEDLLKQAKMCLTTRDHFKAIGDVASANRFEQLALHSKKDLDAVRCAHKRSDPIPKFHYETKSFSIVQCCTDLGDNDLELTILQGINYNVPNPKDVDTYVRYEFPYPSEAPPKDKTALVRDTNNPVYNHTFVISIQRNVRACQRIFRRQSIKLEVWSKGGFLRSDVLIGTVNVKLQPLESKCIIHDSFDLMEGRKVVGGKLEVKIRLRNPILQKQVEQVQEKWLIIDKL